METRVKLKNGEGVLIRPQREEDIIVKMMRPQVAAQKICRKLGFRDEVLIPDYVRDRDGTRQDMVLMRCDLESLWQELESYLATSDWQRTR